MQPAAPDRPKLADRLLTIKAVAALIGVSPRTVRRLESTGVLPAAKKMPGLRGKRIRLVDVECWLAAR
jgi:excisionase family DNA binding protein